MTVKELKELLEQYPDDLQVGTTRYDKYYGDTEIDLNPSVYKTNYTEYKGRNWIDESELIYADGEVLIIE